MTIYGFQVLPQRPLRAPYVCGIEAHRQSLQDLAPIVDTILGIHVTVARSVQEVA